MSIRKDKIIVVDLESTCWRGHTPPGEESEIIEIGVCLLEVATGAISDPRGIFVRPERSTISPFCTELTSITPQMVAEAGLPFPAACEILRADYEAPTRLWGSWGRYDRRMFENQCQQRGVPYPFSKGHLNLKQLFAKWVSGKKMGLTRSLTHVNLEHEGTHHRGVDDAVNTARLLAHMLDVKGRDILTRYD